MTDDHWDKQGPLSDPRVQRAMRKRTREISKTELALIFSVLREPVGRQFYWWVIENLCGTVQATAAFDGPDAQLAALKTYFDEGRRWVGLELMTMAQDAFPDLYNQMAAESLQRQHAETEREERDHNDVSAGDDEDDE
jgi:hypothetical protein